MSLLVLPCSFEYLYAMALWPLEVFYFFQCVDCLFTSESDVYRRQILTYKDGPRAERVKTNVIWSRTALGALPLVALHNWLEARWFE